MTKYGKMIADLVLASHDHPTAEEIYLRLREQGIGISVATVYNNLKTLVDQGILRKITMDGSPDRFDKGTDHQHLICSHCGAIADVELPDMTGLLRKQTGLPVDSYDLRMYWVCTDCRQAMTEVKNEQD